ncbi:uncharacterized protein LOC123904586 [Trifolium pratense]|uniref:uncharacterized protein LOC123904586 n=1 Tax=Trifolium pratense TaxID=57577 RepID=UPI001E6927B1|nr:uncharacterized protein LOC123904586 [Trifolium pratense]
MSPYIFVLCMDKLTHLIAESVDSENWHPLKVGRSRPPISHLMFADDLLLFGKATEINMKAITDSLDRFCDLSGFKEASSLGKYLDIPLVGRAPRCSDFEHLVNKVKLKLSGWKTTNLSFAGRATLTKSVIQAIPIYSMMTTPIPKSVLMDIQRLQRNFIWGHEEGQKKMHMIKWDTLMRDTLKLPKENGGLAVQNLPIMNQACLMKMGWNLREGNNMQSCDNFRLFENWSIGHGKSVHAWRDKWLEGGIVLAQCMENITEEITQWTANMVDEEGNWKTRMLSLMLSPEIMSRITTLPPPIDTDGADERVWPGDPLGRFTISSCMRLPCVRAGCKVETHKESSVGKIL